MHQTKVQFTERTLRQMLPEVKLLGAKDIPVSDCTDDPRDVGPGKLFFVVSPPANGGDLAAYEAAARGAAAVIASKPLPALGVPVGIISNPGAAFARMCHELAGRPSEKLNLIGVTGSFVKTTICHLLASILKTGGIRAGFFGTHFGAKEYAARFPGYSRHDGWSPRAVCNWLNECATAGFSHALLEIPVTALKRSWTAGLVFDCLSLSGLWGSDGIGSRRRAKNGKGSSLICNITEQLRGEGFAVLNADDLRLGEWITELDCPVLTVGLSQASEITAIRIEESLSEQTFLVVAGNETIPVRTRIIGPQHITACLVAVAVGLGYGLGLAEIARGLEAIESIPGRLQRVECGQRFTVFVEEAPVFARLEYALRILRPLVPRRLFCVLDETKLAGFCQHSTGIFGQSEASLLLARLARWADTLVVSTAPLEKPIICREDSALKETFNREESTLGQATSLAGSSEGEDASGGRWSELRRAGPIVWKADWPAALDWALRTAREGDCILVVSGGGQAIANRAGTSRKYPQETALLDYEWIRAWLYENQPQTCG